MQTRRAAIATAGAAACGLFAGCLAFLRGREPLEFGAGPIRVPRDVLEETGYEFVDRQELVVEQEFSVAGSARTVRVTNQLAEHDKAIDLGPLGSLQAAVLTGISTPSVSVLGREFNPLDDMDTAEIAEMAIDRYDEFRNLTHVRDGPIEIGGAETTVSTFTAESTLAGAARELTLHVTEAVPMGDDLVVAVGAHPEIARAEEDHVRTLMRALEPGE